MPEWLSITRGSAPLLLSIPHCGTELPAGVAQGLISPWIARRDADWWVDQLYDFAGELDATVVVTRISRTVIDVNRDPSGASLYPGQATTELCPTVTFDGEPLYLPGAEPDARAIALRTEQYFRPYHDTLRVELERLRARHAAVVLYDCHSIRSRIPRLFAGELPHFNIGTVDGTSCAVTLGTRVAAVCAASTYTSIVNGRFKGGYITRHHGRPAAGVHALQMELACRGYLPEVPGPVHADSWPPPYDPTYAAPLREVLRRVLESCLSFAREQH